MRARSSDAEIHFDIDESVLVPDGPGIDERPTAFLVMADSRRRWRRATWPRCHTGQRVRSFLASRVRNSADVADLAQEVFLRLLRIDRHEHILNPEAYLITIASRVVHQQALKDALATSHAELTRALADTHFAFQPDPTAEIQLQRRLESLDHTLRRLPPGARAAFVLQRRDGYTLDEIAERMGVSRGMVKKHLARALLQCARHIEDGE